MSGQLPNRVGNSLPAQPQPQQANASSSVSSQMQNSGSHRMEPELYKARRFMAQKIYEFFMQRHKKAHEVPRTKMLEIVKNLEERLFKSASTKEEYMNQATLESRLHALVKRQPLNNQGQQISHVNNSSSSGTMIPTPGMPQSGNSNLLKRSSVDDSMVISNGCNLNASSTVSSGNFLPTNNGPSGGAYNSSLSPSDGPFSNGYQQLSSSFSSGSGRNIMVTSRGLQRMATQMIPTPGFNKLSVDNINKNGALGTSQPSPDVGIQVKVEPRMESHDESSCSQAPEKIQCTDTHNRSSQNSMEEHARCTLPSDPQNSCSSKTQISEHLEQFMQQNHEVVSQSNLSHLSSGVSSHEIVQGQVFPNSQDGSQVPVNLPCEPNVQEEFRQRITSKDEAQKNSLFPNVSIDSQSVMTQSEDPSNLSGAASKSINLDRERRFRNSRKWLLGLMHARRCTASEGKCPEPNCPNVQKLLKHIEQCRVIECTYPSCLNTRGLISHHRRCRDASCPVCIPVKNLVTAQLKENSGSNSRSSLPSSVIGSCKPYTAGEVSSIPTLVRSPEVADNTENLQPSLKRMRITQSLPAIVPESETTRGPVPTGSKTHLHQETTLAELNSSSPLKSNGMVVKMECPVDIEKDSLKSVEMKKDNIGDLDAGRPDSYSCMPSNPTAFIKQESVKVEKEVIPPAFIKEESVKVETEVTPTAFIKQESVKVEKGVIEAKQESVSLPSENAGGSKPGKPKIKGVSLTELFTPEQVREHIKGLKQWIGQSKAKVEKNQAMGRSMSENSCQLCAVERLAFEPPPIYCSPCGARIKRNIIYYTISAGDTRHYFCITCYSESRGETILVNGTAIPRGRLEKKKNDEETDEWWVQCDKCEAWQHQICALFNGRRNDGGQAEYTCPNCYVEEVERGERNPLPENAVLGAKDLRRTILSDHIEQRLARKLKQERQERARLQGKSYNETPGAEGLVVRIVSSVDKKFEVKPRFLDMINKEDYPSEFPYKSKVLLLFQKIEGVEVCLFGMYVQEYGSESQQPNHRRVYLSYLDSVKYFRPDVKTITGEALRTFVYHEILIGYLEYCKMRGFTSCYIWACPPLKGEDYILYCHPEIQKSPKSDKLREWYLAMLRKAAKEKVVVDITNLYDHFFMFDGKYTGWVTAARLPYFDGDYWPGAAEDMIYQLQQEEEGRKQQKKGPAKKGVMKRSIRASGQTDLSAKGTKDQLLMHKLGETICPIKEDFIMVHLQHTCSHCCLFMLSGNRWVCNQCKSFQLCDKCYRLEQRRAIWQRHPVDQTEKHILNPVEINDVPADTKDKDENLENEFFDTRQAFLSLCQGNHYQYDTLRRAKHSSMMVLYHLHNPTAPAFVTTCNVCHLDIETGQGWRCETCPDFDVCSACYQKDGGINHPHKFTKHPSVADCDAQNKKRKMYELLVHASQCRNPYCPYENCQKMRALFRHSQNCKIYITGGCVHCKRFWYILHFHARECKESDCAVPRCRDLKEKLKRQQQQCETQQRVAIMERMRQRAAEVTHNS